MGKRIPKSKRHKKLKFVDPCYKGPGREPRNKKILPNEPPTQADYQEVPRQVEDFINLKDKDQLNKFKKKRKKKKKIAKDDFVMVKSDIIENNEAVNMAKKSRKLFKQKKNENKKQFFNRLQKNVDMAITEANFESKYDIKLVNIDEKGDAEYTKPEKGGSERKREKRKKYKQKELEKKKMKFEDEKSDFKKEHIQFGDVVTAPPIFTAKPRKAPEIEKAGKKSLVLKDILSPNSNSDSSKMQGPILVKWKNMAPVKRKIIESERARAVELYRMMRNKKKQD